jgi:hypothetical protein
MKCEHDELYGKTCFVLNGTSMGELALFWCLWMSKITNYNSISLIFFKKSKDKLLNKFSFINAILTVKGKFPI